MPSSSLTLSVLDLVPVRSDQTTTDALRATVSLARTRAFGVTAQESTLEGVGATIARTFTEPGPAVVVVPALLRMFAATHLH